MPVADLFFRSRIVVPCAAATKDAVIASLVELVATTENDRVGLLAEVRAREAQFTTALGDGIALPHARSRFVDTLTVAAVRLAEPVSFDASDGSPVDLAFLVVTPSSSPGAHIEALRALSSILRDPDAVGALRSAETPEVFLDVLRSAEAAVSRDARAR